ncbi:hypothetical protein AAMO2058_000211800 [Amorphochlora amoebiformis]
MIWTDYGAGETGDGGGEPDHYNQGITDPFFLAYDADRTLPTNCILPTKIVPGNFQNSKESRDSGWGPGAFLIAVDSRGHRIVTVAPGGKVSTIAGQKDTIGYQDGEGTNSLFNTPLGIAFTGKYLFVSDSNNCIRKIAPNGEVTTILSGLAFPRSLTVIPEIWAQTVKTGRSNSSGRNLLLLCEGGTRVRGIILDRNGGPEGEFIDIAGGKEGYVDGSGGKARFRCITDLAPRPPPRPSLTNTTHADVHVDVYVDVYVADAAANCLRRIRVPLTAALRKTPGDPRDSQGDSLAAAALESPGNPRDSHGDSWRLPGVQVETLELQAVDKVPITGGNPEDLIAPYGVVVTEEEGYVVDQIGIRSFHLETLRTRILDLTTGGMEIRRKSFLPRPLIEFPSPISIAVVQKMLYVGDGVFRAIKRVKSICD